MMRGGCAIALAVVMGCARPATFGAADPALLIPTEREAVFGQVVRVQNDTAVVAGELLACDGDTIYLRVHIGRSRYVALTRSDWHALEVEGTQQYLASGLWTGLAVVSTLSHGFWLVISAPVWGVVGGVSIGASGRRTETLGACTLEVRSLARWPQGLPAPMRGRFSRLDASLHLREPPAPTPRAPWDP